LAASKNFKPIEEKRPTMSDERDYVLGTHDDEISRLALQHRVWRPRALDAWRRAGFTVGQTLLDIGCGPGHASVDLAEIVGPSGRILAIDRSRRFLDALEATCLQRGLGNITTLELDLHEADLPTVGADGAWSRWIFAFVKRPRDLLVRVGAALKRGGVLVVHEYFDYSTWRVAPRSPDLEEFVRVVMESWRANGGEPDIGLDLPRWLEELGFETKRIHPIIDVVPASNFVWQWPRAFIQVGLRRLLELGHLTPARVLAISEALATSEAARHTLMVTPAVLEIIAVRQ
jgi:SAM-dependent methyltransferase